MRDAFLFPPASVHESYLLWLERKQLQAVDLGEAQQRFLLQFAAFIAACTAGRFSSMLAPDDPRRRNADKLIDEIQAEALQVLQEAVHVAQESPPQCGQKND